MTLTTVTFDITDDIAVLTLNRPTVMNALNSAMRAEITACVARAGREARVLVITGAGRAFCSGQDLVDAGDLETLDLEAVLRDEYVPMLKAIVDCPVPTIAAVNGAAAGAGANLALCCDVILASDAAEFTQAFTRIGLIPDAGGTWFLPRLVGLQRAMGAMLFADRITAHQAKDWGMVYDVAASDGFVEFWQARARQLAKGPTAAYARVKEALRLSLGNDLSAQLAVEARLQGACGSSPDFREGVAAFLEKRPARYTGR